MSFPDPCVWEHSERLLQDFGRFNTTNPPGNEAVCIGHVNDLLNRAGFETSLLVKDSDRLNLVTRLQGEASAPPLLLYGR
jgi:acetylornithine deacetylase/succinyl-diaminopimelate desuccinylase-like protein